MNKSPHRFAATLLAACVVLASAACSESSTPTLCPSGPPTDSLGIATGSGFGALSDEALERSLDAIESSGASWIRFDVDWSTIEPKQDVANWREPDRVVDAALRHGLQVLGIIAYTPQWARVPGTAPGDTHGRPSDPSEFGRFAGRVAQRYHDRVTHWEIWNEPNLQQFFTPAPDVTGYAALLRASATEIRAVQPQATIISGGLSPATDDGSSISPVTFLDGLYASGSRDDFDVVGMHPYSFPALPSDAGTSEWNSFYRMRLMHETMVANGDVDKKIWATEFGAPTGSAEGSVSAAEQAEILRDGINEHRRLGFVSNLFVYSLADRGTDPADREQNFGVLDFHFTPKPAFHVMQDASRTAGCIRK